MREISRTELVWKALAEARERAPKGSGWIFGEREISFREMDEISDRVACGLMNIGLGKGDRIGIIGLNQAEWLYVYFAAAKIGAVVVGLNVRYREVELDYILNHSAAKVLVTLTRHADMNYVEFFKGFRPKVPSVERFVFVDGPGFEGSLEFDALAGTEVDAAVLDRAKAEVRPEDLMIIIYTSGTTGRPKGAAITHQSQLASARAQVEHTRENEDDVRILGAPLNHVGGITVGILAGVLAWSRCVVMPEFKADKVIEAHMRHRPTFFAGVPTMHTLMLSHPLFEQWESKDRIRVITSGGANAEPALLTQLYEAFPRAKVMNLYGMSETSGTVVMSPWESDFEHTIRSIGKPLGDFEAKVVQVDGTKEMPTNEIGELCIRGGAVAAGYFRMPEETREAFGGDGWLRTGDLGRIDEDGYITLVGRSKEMYLQGGFNVYPVEVENVLTRHPKVLMAAGIGVPDPVLGEVGRYYIVPEPGVEPTEDELKAYCRERLADYKVPRRIVIREELPMTPVGKIMKATLKEEYLKSIG
ncbi:MAG: acyl--CoA ligase [Proteobacteria bacterium]|nr:acyl--CoA ligase [Pseudomonadota bacterium]